MSRGLGPGDYIHAKCTGGNFDHNEVFEVITAFCDPSEFKWYVKAKLIDAGRMIRPFPRQPFKFLFDNVKKVSPLVALALCADHDSEISD